MNLEYTYIDSGNGKLVLAGVLEQGADIVTDDDARATIELRGFDLCRHGGVWVNRCWKSPIAIVVE